jgi:hypothetical protein
MEVIIKYANVTDGCQMSPLYDEIDRCAANVNEYCNYIAEITFVNGKPVGITIIHEYKH